MDTNRSLIIVEEQVRNKRTTFIVILVSIALIIGLSAVIGEYLYSDIYKGMFWGAILTAVTVPLNILLTKWAILRSVKGQKIEPEDSMTDQERKIYNMVENLSISAGLSKVPDVYILPTRVQNAFATGLTEKSAVIGLTEGLIMSMTDQELEGVIAHEMGHILNKDILLGTVLAAMMSVIIILSQVVRVFRPSEGSSSKGNNGGGGVVAILFIVLIVLAPLMRLITHLIQMLSSRKREFLADATAVRLCGYNEGLANALERLSGADPYDEAEIKSLGGEHMLSAYISNPLSKAASIFSTHPPIEERIERIRNMH